MGKDKFPNQTINFVHKSSDTGSFAVLDSMERIAVRCVAITNFRNMGMTTNLRIQRSEQLGSQSSARPKRIPIVIPNGIATVLVDTVCLFSFESSITRRQATAPIKVSETLNTGRNRIRLNNPREG